MKVTWIIVLLFFIAIENVYSEDSKCHRSTEGTDFWFGFMEGRNYRYNLHYIEITITASEATNFRIFTGKSTIPLPVTDFVNAGESVQIKLPLDLAEATGSEKIQERGIHLVADKPVNLYALNWDRNSADVAVIYPVESLGKEYFTMCYTPNVDPDPTHGRNSEFLIVASKDTTLVEIIPSKVTDALREAGVPFTVTLNKGEVYQVQSLNQNNLPGQGDLTGSYIRSDKPVAVYSGNFSTTIPVVNGMGGFDHLYEQIPPVQTWGREYYAVPLYTRYADLYRVIASEDNTNVQIGNNPPFILNRGAFKEFTLNHDNPSRIYADKPVMVAQFSQSNGTDEWYTGGNGDPFMIILSSVSQFKNEATFVAYFSNQITDYYVNIVSLTSEKENIELDGEPLGVFLKPFGGTGYSYTQHKIYAGKHTIKNLNPDRGFLAYVYGFGGYESYGYGVGFNLDLILDLGQSINFQGDTLPICSGEEIVLDAGPYFDDYLWNTGDTTQKITVKKQDKYWARGTTVDGCTQSDTLYILVSKPVKPELGPDIQVCSPETVQLDAGEGYASYKWNSGENTRIIEADKTYNYNVEVKNEYGCITRDTMNLTVFPTPVISMTGPTLICGSKSLKVTLNFEEADENMLSSSTMIWDTNRPDELTFSNKTKVSADIEVKEWGEYQVFYKFTTSEGCEIPDTIQLQFWDTPTSKITPVDNPNDKCSGYSREIKYEGNATADASFLWDFDGCYADSLDWNLRRVSLGAYSSNPSVSLTVEENGCRSDTSMISIGANPDFVMNTVKSRGCDSATVMFSGQLNVQDSLRFEWDFGDNSPVSNLQNPSHFYSSTGSYNVGLLITNLLNGCKVGYEMENMVKIFPTPEVDIAVDSEFCNDKTVDVYYLQNIDSSFCTWEFSGAKEIGEGNDSITILIEKQIASIRLQVEEFGCKSKWAETTVRRKPIFDLTTDISEGCQPLKVLAGAVTSDEDIQFKWLTDSLISDGNEHYFILPDAGKYDFTLAGYSNLTGCSDTITRKEMVLVHPKPEVKFDVDYPVAIIEQATLHFTNFTPDVEIFKWNFGDGGTSTEENPLHTYLELGKFPVELAVESEFGCIDTGRLTVEILPFNVYTPNAFRPDSEIPENREFMPVGVGVDPEAFQMQIFNRWGEMIFETTSLEKKWDGTTKNNKPAPMGNYIWKSEFKDVQGFHHSMKGQVLLIR